MDKEILFDTRPVNRLISRKVISTVHYEKSPNELLDVSANAENIELFSRVHLESAG